MFAGGSAETLASPAAEIPAPGGTRQSQEDAK
jgi:hypothetical protein